MEEQALRQFPIQQSILRHLSSLDELAFREAMGFNVNQRTHLQASQIHTSGNTNTSTGRVAGGAGFASLNSPSNMLYGTKLVEEHVDVDQFKDGLAKATSNVADFHRYLLRDYERGRIVRETEMRSVPWEVIQSADDRQSYLQRHDKKLFRTTHFLEDGTRVHVYEKKFVYRTDGIQESSGMGKTKVVESPGQWPVEYLYDQLDGKNTLVQKRNYSNDGTGYWLTRDSDTGKWERRYFVKRREIRSPGDLSESRLKEARAHRIEPPTPEEENEYVED
jgi:hypothetical protein